MQRTSIDRFGNVAAFGLVLFVNFLANALPLGGQNTGAISDGFPSLFTPAGFTFAIWGLIYLALLGFVIRQLLKSESHDDSLREMSVPFQISCLANVGWLFSWHFDQLALSMVFMLVLLGSLIRVYLVLNRGGFEGSFVRWLLVAAPFSLYLGWITVATLANVSIIQSANGWNDALLAETTWTLLKLGAALILALWVGIQRKDGVYVLVIAWAAYGISAGQASSAVVSSSALTLSYVTLLFGLTLLYHLRRHVQYKSLD
ncbi:tryptophan-rich sensory protein [bacterium]|nr:tryptophan-rich sensory protein [bacterium]